MNNISKVKNLEKLLTRILYEKWKSGELKLKPDGKDEPIEWQGKLEDEGIWVIIWTDYKILNVQKSNGWVIIDKDPYVDKLCWEIREKHAGEVIKPNLEDILKALGVV